MGPMLRTHLHCTDLRANPFCAPQASESLDVGCCGIGTSVDIL